MFREFNLIKNLDITEEILSEAMFPKIFVPYPLDHSKQELLTWQQIK